MGNFRFAGLKLASYVKARLAERATWAAIALAVTGAAALVVPWNYVFIVVGVIGALVPTQDNNHDHTD